nr:hypothetical protein [Kibdelosporangium sp. MJ126-NF4]CTQ94559.1 hypothetical protein [Kibdelosporangium sp. MJ126-NF4]
MVVGGELDELDPVVGGGGVVVVVTGGRDGVSVTVRVDGGGVFCGGVDFRPP